MSSSGESCSNLSSSCERPHLYGNLHISPSDSLNIHLNTSGGDEEQCDLTPSASIFPDSSTVMFPVPKCLFSNICSLNKTIKKVRAFTTLAADMRSLDIDVAVISETHLNNMILDSVAAIDGYTIHRRDRDWGGKDKRKKGGIAVYVREQLKVLDVKQDSAFEMISLRLLLPSSHQYLGVLSRN